MEGLFGPVSDEYLRSIKLGPSTKIDEKRFAEFLSDVKAKRICFDTTHQAALKEWPSGEKYQYNISLPFSKTIGPIIKEETGVQLRDSSNSETPGVDLRQPMRI